MRKRRLLKETMPLKIDSDFMTKAGWVSHPSFPQMIVGHFPKTFRTPATRYPKHVIRTTWVDWEGVHYPLVDDDGSINLGTMKLPGLYKVPAPELTIVAPQQWPLTRKPQFLVFAFSNKYGKNTTHLKDLPVQQRNKSPL